MNYKKLLILFIICFFSIINVNAESGIVTDADGVNLREEPNVEATKLLSIPKNHEFYISNLNAGEGNGCNNPWYYVYYKGQYGYLCSTYVEVKDDTESEVTTETSYSRPWTTPKKAIVGGAEFISKSYIAKGQFTSYLKKFNVNPNGYYSVYNHQYMANLRAPASEAYTTYKSMRDNNLLDNAINFVIPVFTNMPQSTYDVNIKDTELQTADIQDEEFETSINAFDESYKPYLRYLHTIHPNWTFDALITNLDFETSYLSEKAVCSIEISSGLCEQNPYEVTEKGWCIGSESATKFFLDPRNFLSEKYIFMFENLGYTEKYNEPIVQTVLNNTFMNDLSVLDNQTYASIFVEAGLGANISPLYLASLARQESGTSLSLTTSGEEFEYEGYTYSGLYNFFNIGAYSSATNPAKAGLVYANGGKGINIANPIIPEKPEDNIETPEKIPTQTEIDNDFISQLAVAKTKEYIKGYKLGTLASEIKTKINENTTIVIKDNNGNIINDNNKIATGYTIEMSNKYGNISYIYVLYGDLSGDGEIDSADLLKMRQHLLNKNILTNSQLESSDVNKDGIVDSADLLLLRQNLLGKKNIEQ